MRDPHVVSLTYGMKPVSATFDNPPPIEKETDQFMMKLADSVVTFEMKVHFATVPEARAAVCDFLRSWEIDSHMKGLGITFHYEDAKRIDRNPPLPGEPQDIRLEPLTVGVSVGGATVCITSRKYPEPPSDFETNPDVETLWNRYNGSLEGREPLQSMGYFCLTVVEASAGTAKQAADKYKTSQASSREIQNFYRRSQQAR